MDYLAVHLPAPHTGIFHQTRKPIMVSKAIVFACSCGFVLTACDPQASYEAAVDQQMEQINTDAQKMMGEIEMQVATDAVEQCGIVVQRGGSAMDRCVQAGMVAAAFLQAKAASRYEEWKTREKADCKAAGLQM